MIPAVHDSACVSLYGVDPDYSFADVKTIFCVVLLYAVVAYFAGGAHDGGVR